MTVFEKYQWHKWSFSGLHPARFVLYSYGKRSVQRSEHSKSERSEQSELSELGANQYLLVCLGYIGSFCGLRTLGLLVAARFRCQSQASRYYADVRILRTQAFEAFG
jgi:hypothetical protein